MNANAEYDDNFAEPPIKKSRQELEAEAPKRGPKKGGSKNERSKDFWYNLCATYESLSTPKPNKKDFLDTADSGSDINGSKSNQVSFGRYLKFYKEGKLLPSQMKRNKERSWLTSSHYLWAFAVSNHACSAQKVTEIRGVTLLIIQSDAYDWDDIFGGARLQDGRRVIIVQTGWESILVRADTSSSDQRPYVEIQQKSCRARDEKRPPRRLRPDFVLIRDEVITPSFNAQSLLNGLLIADVPSINSLESINYFCNHGAVMAKLHSLQRKLGEHVFPVIPQHFASNSRALFYGGEFPAVLKVGSAGKMRVMDHKQICDLHTVLAMMPHEHCFVEAFVESSCSIRIQKIGDHLRAFKQMGASGAWKASTGIADMKEVPLEPQWKTWIVKADEMFGGLDILTLDAVIEKTTGREYILGANGTSSKLHPDCAGEDNALIYQLVLEKMDAVLGKLFNNNIHVVASAKV